jgi:hypothetical protein
MIQLPFKGGKMEAQPVVRIPYLAESDIAWTRVFRLLGALSIVFGLAQLLMTLLDPVQMFLMALYANYDTADFSLGEFFAENWLRWVRAVASLLVAIGGFWCFLRPTRARLLILSLTAGILINVFYLVLVGIAISQTVRSGEFDGFFAILKIALQSLLELVFPSAVILLARMRRRQMRTQV